MKYSVKHIILPVAALCALPSLAQQLASVTTDNVLLERNGKYLSVDMDVDVSQLDVRSDRAVVFTPWLVGSKDSIVLKSIGIYGRQRYYYYLRNEGQTLTGADEQYYRASECPEHIAYHDDLTYADWMNGANLILRSNEYGCCNNAMGAPLASNLAHYTERTFAPQPLFVRPEAEAHKTLQESGSALVIFPVNSTKLIPTLANNDAELTRIRGEVQRIEGDSDVYDARISLCGYASPEGTYANNTRLAEGRTEALRSYLQRYFHLSAADVTAQSVPENWTGLRAYVEASDIEHRTEILSLIDDEATEPDAREARIKSRYPSEYAALLRDCYPNLRRTDYRIDYGVRQYTDIEEIKRIYKTNPKKLSLNELYLLAQTYQVGTDEFNDVFETAVRLYPTDPTANLNAANLALRRGEVKKCAEYLEQSGDSPEATYTRGVLAALNADYGTAVSQLREAAAGGVTQAQDALDQLAACHLIQ